MEKNKTNHKKLLHLLTTFSKVVLVFTLLYFLLSRGFISIQAMRQALKRWDKILPAALASFISILLGVHRWQLLLKAQNIKLQWSRVLQLTFVGNFFNIALPGAVSGDFVKAIYIGRELKGRSTSALGSILFDRVAGLSALVLLSAFALGIGLKDFANSPVLSNIGRLLGLSSVAVVAFYTYLFLVQEHHDPLLRFFRWSEKKIHKFKAITRIYESLRHYHNHRKDVIQVLLISVLIHVLVGWSCFLLASALGETHLTLLSIYLVVPIGLLVNAIPLAPGGIGTGNIAFLYLFHLIGSERGADIFSLMALMNLAFGAIGGLVYFQFKSQNPDLVLNHSQT